MTNPTKVETFKHEIVIHDEQELARYEDSLNDAKKQLDATRMALAQARTEQRCARRALRRLRAAGMPDPQQLQQAQSRLQQAQENLYALRSEERGRKATLREARSLYKATRQRCEARRKAVRRFLRRWERDYDGDIRRRAKKVKLRQQWDQADLQSA